MLTGEGRRMGILGLLSGRGRSGQDRCGVGAGRI